MSTGQVLDYQTHSKTRSRLSWLGWAIYLAMSWTWCIGMFLPVLLVRDYGIWGWVVFAAPNVVGAAAMGWVIRTAQTSRDLTRAHSNACRLFSLSTIAFHVFFAVWMLVPLIGMGAPLLMIVAATLSYLVARPSNTSAATATVVTLTLSISLFAYGFFARELPYLGQRAPLQPLSDLRWVALICLFGFAFCPYLDLTFHRARQHVSARDARIAFTLGFSVLFLAMILFTLAYSGWLRQLIEPYYEGRLPPLVAAVIGWHMLAQSALTTGLHVREVVTRSFTGIALCFAAAGAVGVLMVFPQLVFGNARVSPGVAHGEPIYRLFMGFYALVFPAYVWLCMIPSPRSKPSRRSLIVFAVAVLVAAPMFWMGFIEGRMIWLLPGLALVLLARLAVPRRVILGGSTA